MYVLQSCAAADSQHTVYYNMYSYPYALFPQAPQYMTLYDIDTPSCFLYNIPCINTACYFVAPCPHECLTLGCVKKTCCQKHTLLSNGCYCRYGTDGNKYKDTCLLNSQHIRNNNRAIYTPTCITPPYPPHHSHHVVVAVHPPPTVPAS